MKTRTRSTILASTTLASLLLLSACGKSEPPAPPAVTPPAATTASPPAAMPPPAASGSAAMPASGTTAAQPASAGSSASVTSPVAAPAAAPALAIAKVTLGDAVNAQHEVSRPASSFAADDKAIYASVATTGSSAGATLNAKWSYLEGQGQLVSSITQSIATDGPAVTTFKVQNPDLWPEGKYRVQISLDGKPVSTQDFAIRKS
jgi:hypothetical protein